MNRARSQLITPAFSDCGYTGTMRPVRSPMRSTTGLVIFRRPWNTSSRPNSTTSVPAFSCRSRKGWLKKLIWRWAVPSVTSVVTRDLPLRVRRDVVRTTFTSTVASSPTSRSPSRAWFVRSR